MNTWLGRIVGIQCTKRGVVSESVRGVKERRKWSQGRSASRMNGIMGCSAQELEPERGG